MQVNKRQQIRAPRAVRGFLYSFRVRLLGAVLVSGLALTLVSRAWCGPDPLIISSQTKSPGSIRAETIDIANGGELVVFFERLRADAQSAERREMPLLAVLRDTLRDADPANDRLRQVWVFTYASPSPAQRIAAGVPFLYHRLGLPSGSSIGPPHAALDLARPAQGLWPGIAFSVAQSQVLDPLGSFARLTTHSYGGNLGEYRRTHIAEVLDVIARNPGQLSSVLTSTEVETLEGRLELSSKPLGGLVGDESLPSVYIGAIKQRTQNRGHNWELLRQIAEQNGLYFEPLRLDATPDSFGVIWIAQRDATTPVAEGPEESRPHPFEGHLLHISNPFHDERIRSWKGYSQVWTLNREGGRVTDGTDDGTPMTMIPLAIYALDYPGVPLLLIDFRDASHPQRTERRLRAANDVTSGIFGLTAFGNFGYFAAKTGFLFVHKRHGAATDRLSRRKAFIALRHALATGDSLDEAMRHDLESRIERLDLDPVEQSRAQEVRTAWHQYDALMKFAADPNGLAKTLEHDRVGEYRAITKGPLKRMAATVFHPHADINDKQLTELSERRRLAWSKRQRIGLPDEGASAQADANPSSSPVPIRVGGAGR